MKGPGAKKKMSNLEKFVNLNEEGRKIYGLIFPDGKIPVTDMSIKTATFEGQNGVHNIYLLDWQKLTENQKDSLVNLLSGKKVVNELIQKNATAENIFLELKKILTNSDYRQEMITNLIKIKVVIGDKNPSTRVALMAGELAGWQSTGA